jgi:DNA-binding PucR family transcriptional regulator
MTDTQPDQIVEPQADIETFPVECDDDVGRAIVQARVFHDLIDQMKIWSAQEADEIIGYRVERELGATDPEFEELRQASEVVQSVYRRIQSGDQSLPRP